MLRLLKFDVRFTQYVVVLVQLFCVLNLRTKKKNPFSFWIPKTCLPL